MKYLWCFIIWTCFLPITSNISLLMFLVFNSSINSILGISNDKYFWYFNIYNSNFLYFNVVTSYISINLYFSTSRLSIYSVICLISSTSFIIILSESSGLYLIYPYGSQLILPNSFSFYREN